MLLSTHLRTGRAPGAAVDVEPPARRRETRPAPRRWRRSGPTGEDE